MIGKPIKSNYRTLTEEVVRRQGWRPCVLLGDGAEAYETFLLAGTVSITREVDGRVVTFEETGKRRRSDGRWVYQGKWRE